MRRVTAAADVGLWGSVSCKVRKADYIIMDYSDPSPLASRSMLHATPPPHVKDSLLRESKEGWYPATLPPSLP